MRRRRLSRQLNDLSLQLAPDLREQRLDQLWRPPDAIVERIIDQITCNHALHTRFHRLPDINEPSQRAGQLHERHVHKVAHMPGHPLTHIQHHRLRRLRRVEGVPCQVQVARVVLGEVKGVCGRGKGFALGGGGENVDGGLSSRNRSAGAGEEGSHRVVCGIEGDPLGARVLGCV